MEPKQRHGCLTAWLIFSIIANSLTALVYFFAGDLISERIPGGVPTEMLVLLGVVGIANVIFAVFLFQWKKWAFWGFVISALCTFAINISIGLGIGQSFLGLVGIGVLYGVLQIKQENVSAWQNME